MPEISIDQLTDKEVLDAAEMVETTGIDVITAICAATNKAIRGDDEGRLIVDFRERIEKIRTGTREGERREGTVRQEDLNYSASKLADEMGNPKGLKDLFYYVIKEVYTGGAMVMALAKSIIVASNGLTIDACMTALVGYHKGELTVEQAKKIIGLKAPLNPPPISPSA